MEDPRASSQQEELAAAAAALREGGEVLRLLLAVVPLRKEAGPGQEAVGGQREQGFDVEPKEQEGGETIVEVEEPRLNGTAALERRDEIVVDDEERRGARE